MSYSRGMHETVDPAVLEAARDQAGRSLAEWTADGPVLLVFLRHYG